VRQSVRLGRVAGIPVGAHWSVAVILVIITMVLGLSVLPAALPHQPAGLYWGVAVAGAVAFMASLAAHEFAHAIVARRNGVGVRSITLWMLGGVAELEGDPPSPGADLRIALAGPVTSLLAGGVFVGAAALIGYAGGPTAGVVAAGWLGVMNGVLAVFNLLPGAPLDGGRVLRALLWHRWGNWGRAERAAAQSGRVLGAAIAGLGLAEMLFGGLVNGLWLMLIGWFLVSAARAEQNAAAAAAALAGVRVADVMIAHPDLAPGWATVAGFIDQVAAHSAQSAFPVVGFDGQLAGIVTAGQLARIPPGQRTEIRLDRIATPVSPEYLAAPGDPAGPLAGRRPLGGEIAAIVLADDRVTGLVRPADLQRMLRWRRLTRAGV
jgi:Zn-dependent protease/CBS domain-containing protein